ncbi:MAG: O-antigen ligase family protein [Candidatus Roizmanbacteria bacterium]|nr:O-antigen ligase family protein [Candidatus Roizmanbacteria bacterium]
MEHRARERLLFDFNNLHRWLFYLLLLLIPTQLGYHFWPDFAFVNGIRVDYLAPTIYATDVLVAGILLSWLFLAVRKTHKIPHVNYGVSLVCISFFSLNIFFSLHPILAFIQTLTILKLVFLIFYIMRTKPPITTSGYFLLAGLMYSCFIAWMQFSVQSSLGGIWWFLGERTFDVATPGIATVIINNRLLLRPYATFPHPNVLAGFITALLPLIWYNTSPMMKKIKLPLLIFFLATLFITFSRSAWIVAGIILLAIPLIRRPREIINKSNRLVLLALAALLVGLSPFLFERVTNLSSVDFQSVSRRIDLNYAALNMIKDNPVFGVGLNNFLVSLPNYITINSYQDLQPAHNIYLLFLAEWGIAGAATILLLVVNSWPTIRDKIPARNASHSDAGGRNTKYGILLSVTILLLLGLFDHYPYTIHQMQLLTAISIGFILTGRTRLITSHETH